jgi:hypothetical protein
LVSIGPPLFTISSVTVRVFAVFLFFVFTRLFPHFVVKKPFDLVTERWVTNVVSQRRCLNNFRVEIILEVLELGLIEFPEQFGEPSPDLCDLQ